MAEISAFDSFFEAKWLAAEPALTDVADRYVGAKVSPTVASHARHFPSLQGINVMPSGRLQSDFSNRGGSFLAGKLARDRER